MIILKICKNKKGKSQKRHLFKDIKLNKIKLIRIFFHKIFIFFKENFLLQIFNHYQTWIIVVPEGIKPLPLLIKKINKTNKPYCKLY